MALQMYSNNSSNKIKNLIAWSNKFQSIFFPKFVTLFLIFELEKQLLQESPQHHLPLLRKNDSPVLSMNLTKSQINLPLFQRTNRIKNNTFKNRATHETYIRSLIKNDKEGDQSFAKNKLNQIQSKFRSTKAVKFIKIKPMQYYPSVKTAKQQYKMRQLNLQRYLSEPKILDEYRILSHLGKGCFSIVELAINKLTNIRYAIKVYNKIDEIEAYKFDNIQREINHLLELKHQNVVGLYHVIKNQRKVMLVMEDAGKMSIAALLRKNKIIAQPIAKIIFRQILEGIKHCHQKNICHRDLKLQNILVDSDNKVKIIDFGFSSKCGQKLINHCGTPPYMSPQIAAKLPYYGEPADIWALGVVLYLMLYGQFPFRAANQKQLYRIIQQGKIKLDQGVSIQGRDAISRMLKCKVKDRATAAQMLHCSWFR